MTFIYERTIRFADVDPAGIVFYPRYFEMINEVVEEWFRQELGTDFAQLTLKERRGAPLVKIATEFKTPGRLYETLSCRLAVNSIGNSSVNLAIVAEHEGVRRFSAELVLVFIDLDAYKSAPIPPALRALIEKHVA